MPTKINSSTDLQSLDYTVHKVHSTEYTFSVNTAFAMPAEYHFQYICTEYIPWSITYNSKIAANLVVSFVCAAANQDKNTEY